MRRRTEPLGECSIESCTRTAKYASTGWCQTHYHRWWRTGDPLGVKQERGASGPATVNWKGDDITYRTAHTRVVRLRGLASQHDCVVCGARASEWSYDHTDPAEKQETIQGWRGIEWTVSYSADVERYEPLCRLCHIRRDRKGGWPRRTHCVNGHRFDAVNTYVRPGGERNCRTCQRERMAAKRLARKEDSL